MVHSTDSDQTREKETPNISGSSSACNLGSDTNTVEKGLPAPSVVLPEEPETRNITGFKWILVVTSILSSHMLFALDNTIVANIQPAIVEEYHSPESISWLSVAFALCSSALVLPWSKFYGVFNAKWLYIGTLTLFMAGSALCGAAPTMDAMIVGRALAGAGGSGMYFGVLTLLSVTTTVKERPFYIGLTAVSWGLGTVCGPALGGAFAQSAATWRFAFYINLIIGAVFAPVYAFLLPSFDPMPNADLRKRMAQIDWVGIVLIAAALGLLVLGIDFGGVKWEWKSAPIIVFFILSGVLFVAFGVQQTYLFFCDEQTRLFPIHFLKRKSLSLLFILNTCASSGLFISIYYIPLFFQFTKGDSAIQASVRLLPFVLVLIFVIILNGHVMSWLGYYLPWYLVGSMLELVSAALLYTVTTKTSIGAIYGYTVIMAVGVGAFNQAGYSVVQAKVRPDEIPKAVGFMMVSQLGGIVIALGAAGAIYVNKAQAGLQALLPDLSPEIVKSGIAGTAGGFLESLPTDKKGPALDIIVNSIDEVYILLIVAGALGVVLSLFLKREKLFMTVAAGGA